MREMVDKAVETIDNFFKGFLTFEQIKKSVNKPIR